MKIKKQHRRKQFMYRTNRKRLREKMEKNTKHNVKVADPILKENWDHRKSVKENMKQLGVAFDANKSVSRISNPRNKFKVTDIEADKEVVSDVSVVAQLEAVAAVEKPPAFRFSLDQVKWISDMMDKHKLNFKAMARDPMNHYQETPKAIEKKIRKFMSIPEQYAVYCRERGLLESEQSEN
eukprot:TRINITY_DN13349_c0_g1_i1.p1 TRINITY_DN13349_c0_g1~~TRINITY_DN13349_c0_g1_i1.p1  ORF type:complete len:181 (+),score=23.26 TRINITY_DN13349_c0_g1_i1:107-649(+)